MSVAQNQTENGPSGKNRPEHRENGQREASSYKNPSSGSSRREHNPDGKTQRRKRVPGTSDLIKQIREINDRINVLDQNILDCKNMITEIIKEEKENSPKGKLIEEKQQIFDDLKNLKSERDTIKREKSKILPEYLKLKDVLESNKKKYNLKETRQQIQQKIEKINKKIMLSKLTTQQEREFEKELMELKRKKSMTEEFKELEVNLKVYFDKIDIFNKEIDKKVKEEKEKMAKLTRVKQELDLLKDKKIRNSKIEENDRKIDSFKKEKNDLIEKRKKLQENIREKERNHERMLREMELQMKQEKEKKEIKSKIYEKEKSKNNYLKEISEIDPSKFDIISNELKQVKQCNIPMSLFLTLTSVKLPVPKTEEELKELITRIQSEKEKYQNDIKEKIEEIQTRIKKIDLEITQEKEKLEKFPQKSGGSHAELRKSNE